MGYELPRLCFGLVGASFSVSMVQACFLPDTMETNERASMQDSQTVLFYQKQSEALIHGGKMKKPGCCQIFCFKMRLIKKGFSERVLVKYVTFLFI